MAEHPERTSLANRIRASAVLLETDSLSVAGIHHTGSVLRGNAAEVDALTAENDALRQRIAELEGR